MKKLGRIFVAFALTLSLSGVPTIGHASKAPAPGAKCSKAKLTQVSNGKTFTCVKTKSGLKWNKGVRVKAPTPTPSVSPTVSVSATPSATQAVYTMDRVRANNSSASCWTVIDGFVYDLTNWISAHPGGPGVIRSLCGVDGTSSFKAQHENQRNPAQRLSSYLLGPLSK